MLSDCFQRDVVIFFERETFAFHFSGEIFARPRPKNARWLSEICIATGHAFAVHSIPYFDQLREDELEYRYLP